MVGDPATSKALRSYLYVASYTYPNIAPGSSTVSDAHGISVFEVFNDGSVELIQVAECENPSFLTVNNDQTMLYCVNELGVDDTELLGRVSAFRIDQSNGKLAFLNTQSTAGNWPCHCQVHSSGRYLLTANYGSQNFIVHALLKDGSLGEMVDAYQNSSNGSGPEHNRQSASHPHMMLTNPGGQHVFGVDLGTDQVLSWSLDIHSGKLTPGEVPSANVASGSGSRHMVFHPDDQQAYVLNELSSTIDVFDFDAIRGAFIWKQSASTLPEETDLVRPQFDASNPGLVPSGSNTGGEICIDPSGRFVYSSNRGGNTIAIFKVNQLNGKLSALDWVSTGGINPRGMQMEPGGKYLFVGNQSSNNITVFEINAENGLLDSPINDVACPVPTDFAFKTIS